MMRPVTHWRLQAVDIKRQSSSRVVKQNGRQAGGHLRIQNPARPSGLLIADSVTIHQFLLHNPV